MPINLPDLNVATPGNTGLEKWWWWLTDQGWSENDQLAPTAMELHDGDEIELSLSWPSRIKRLESFELQLKNLSSARLSVWPWESPSLFVSQGVFQRIIDGVLVDEATVFCRNLPDYGTPIFFLFDDEAFCTTPQHKIQLVYIGAPILIKSIEAHLLGYVQ